MEHSYRTLQHWNHWLTHDFLGEQLLRAEREALTKMLAQHFGKHALLIGVPNQSELLHTSTMPYQSLLGPLILKQADMSYVETGLHELPLLTGSVDLVILPHTLEFIDNPRQLLAEACRVIKPEGLIVICGFNPYSTWGIKKIFTKDQAAPWIGNFIQPNKIKTWLKLAEFEMENQTSAMFSPPVATQTLFEKFNFLETVGRKWCHSLGGTYMIAARAKVIPLTPIKLKWKQQLNGLRLPTTISGHIVSSSESATK